jgi:hypothetical protein
MLEYPIHPKCADVREMTEAEYARLVASFKARGYDPAYPIILYDGMILDGRHRYRVCRELGIMPQFIEWAPCGDDTPAMVVLRSLARRHLSKSELAAYAVEDALPEQEAKAAARQKKGKADLSPKVGQGKAAVIVAEAAGVSKTYVEGAKKLKETAPAEFEKVKRGEKSIPQAIEDAKPAPPPPPTIRVDEAGRVVSKPEVADALDAGPAFDAIVKAMREIQRRVKELAATPHGYMIGANTAKTIGEMAHHIAEAKPYTTKPDDTGKHGREIKAPWLTEQQWNALPKEYRK